VALQLKRAGIRKVRPLAGGFEAWRKLGLPVEAATALPRDTGDPLLSSTS
jgi:3-mercaptopyruvate sulfurtransferase SseA